VSLSEGKEGIDVKEKMGRWKREERTERRGTGLAGARRTLERGGGGRRCKILSL
jgi:hypothetical protein